MSLRFVRLACGIALFTCLPSRASAAPVLPSRRIAVLVGANAAPAGRRELRFALDDARRMADVLGRVGRFAPSDVHVLLEPSARTLTELLDQLATQVDAASDTLLVFYYSGHSDGQALYPQGETLLLADVRERLLRIRARVRVGILDTCRGGSWTQAKDLSVGPPLPEADVAALTSEGTVLVAASSGFENAHEAEALRGSFFTHHFSAGLLGAADRSGDGNITVQEAFEYARERTVRDSARYAPLPQHPSFEIDLRGRQDVVLTQIGASGSSLELVQTQGPFEVIHLASGVTVAELPSGARRVRLALPPGRYLVRRVTPGQIYSQEVEVATGGVTSVAESQLETPAATTLAMKGGDALPAPMSMSSSLPAHWWELRLAAGVDTGPASQTASSYDPHSQSITTLKRSFSLSGGISYAFTDRLTWSLPLPAFAYRIGEQGHFEVFPRIGLIGVGYSSTNGLLGVADAGVSARLWTGLQQSVIANISGQTKFSIHTAEVHPDSRVDTWSLHADAGYGLTIHNVVSLYLGVGFQRWIQANASGTSGNALQFGSVLMLGYRSLPLVQVHLTRQFSLDAYATWAVVLESGDLSDSYLAGFTWNF
jgi:opacity protein-like surface antigen